MKKLTIALSLILFIGSFGFVSLVFADDAETTARANAGNAYGVAYHNYSEAASACAVTEAVAGGTVPSYRAAEEAAFQELMEAEQLIQDVYPEHEWEKARKVGIALEAVRRSV